MRKILQGVFILVLLGGAFSAMAKYGELRGVVVDQRTGEVLPGANIRIVDSSKGTVTEKYLQSVRSGK